MEIKHLQSFISVVNHKSFSKAANELYISQPTISAHISQLEEELGKRLIIRTTKSIEITPKGNEVYEYAVNLLNLRDRIVDCCSEQSHNIIHVGASTIPSAYILPDILPSFGSSYPNIYFAIHQDDSANITKGLTEGLFDIGLIGEEVKNDAIECIPFCADRMIVITPVTDYYLNLKKQSITPIDELLKEPIILRETGSGSKKTADRFLESLNISENQLHIAARVNDQEAIKNLVASGLGISIISAMAAQNFLSEKRLLSFDLSEYNVKRNLYIIYKKNYILNHDVQTFMKYIINTFADDTDLHH